MCRCKQIILLLRTNCNFDLIYPSAKLQLLRKAYYKYMYILCKIGSNFIGFNRTKYVV